jgi:hypothetical protein
MALPVTDETEQDPRKRRAGEGVQDPLFYEGMTPVLGEDVSISEPKGELQFPQASPAVGPMPAPIPAPLTMPAFPQFPNFEFNWELTPPEFQFNPGQPPPPPNITLPQAPEVPWWAKALGAEEAARGVAGKAYDVYRNAQAGGATAGGLNDPNALNPSQFSSPSTGLGGEALFPQGGPIGAGGPEVASPEALFPQGGAAEVPSPGFTGYVGPALSALGLGMGTYGAIQAEPGSPEQISSGLGAASGLLGLLGPAGLGVAGIGASAAPVAGLLAAPFILGSIFDRYGPGSADQIQVPPGWQYVPGSGTSRGVGGYVVDPASGRVLQYGGKGNYTMLQQPITPEQMRQYGIEPTGKLAEVPAYASIPTELRNADIAQAGQPRTEGGQPIPPSAPHVRSFLEEWRQPYIDKLKAAHPGADEGELWRLYTLSPEYQQELAMQQGWTPETRYGEGR